MPAPFFNGLGEAILETFKDVQQAVFTPQVGPAQPIDVIFNDRHEDVDLNGIPYGAPKPTAWIRTGLVNPAFNDTLVINSVSYLIKEIKPDGLELTQLTLTAP